MKILSLDTTNGFVCKQTDWGCWVAIASPDKILEVLNEWYGDDPIPSDSKDDSGSPIDLREIIQRLESRNYALVALES